MTTLLSQPAEAPAAPIRGKKRGGGVWRSFLSNRKANFGFVLFFVLLVMALFPSLFTDVDDPTAPARFMPRLPPSGDHWLGTTSLGQDVWALFVYGAREPLIIAVVAGGLATIISVFVGVSAAYLGGVADDVISFITNVVLVIPTFPLVIVLSAYSGKPTLTVMVSVLVVTGWSYGANQLRAQALSLRNRDFLESARVRGERRSYIIVFEMLPTMISLIIANFLGAALFSVLNAAGLQFLGLGDPNSDSWGTMLYWADSQSALENGAEWWAIAPALGIAALGVAFALMNYAFDEISNPALRPVRRQRGKQLAARLRPSVPAQAGPADALGGE
ncbi:ABC transporter permease [Catenulispora yoronensis]|uniref:ABC transporter permease n=1 Tax=Catenulispora yoronensis TaxID=450799 RepID=A0ABN2V9Z0_9ACTN